MSANPAQFFRRWLGLCVVPLVVACTVENGPGAATPSNNSDPYADIMAVVQRVDGALPTFQEHERTLLGISAEGADVTAYLDGTTPRKIEVEALGETGKGLTSYYFQDGHLVFATSKVIRFSHSIAGEPLDDSEPLTNAEKSEGVQRKEAVVENERFYFHDDALIRWERAGKVLSAPEVDYRMKERELEAAARSYARWMSTPLTEEQRGTCFWTAEYNEATDALTFHCE